MLGFRSRRRSGRRQQMLRQAIGGLIFGHWLHQSLKRIGPELDLIDVVAQALNCLAQVCPYRFVSCHSGLHLAGTASSSN